MRFLETIRAEHGRLFHLEYHQKRLNRALLSIGSDVDYRLSELLTPPSSGLYRCRIIYDEYGLTTEYLPYSPRTFHSLQAVIDDGIEYSHKYADRKRLDRLLARRASCDDVVIIKDGLLTDTTIANIAVYDGDQWLTPATPLLPGTTRARLLDEGKLIEADISLESLPRYQATAIMNAMLGFVQVENGIISPK